jgi:hypothetical protein
LNHAPENFRRQLFSKISANPAQTQPPQAFAPMGTPSNLKNFSKKEEKTGKKEEKTPTKIEKHSEQKNLL